MDNRPIGIFDSGVGGLSVLKEIKKRLPKEDIIYFGDTARVPYGTKSASVVRKYAFEDAAFLLSKNVKIIVVACNTASSIALEDLKKLRVPVVGVVEPAARRAAELADKKIGIIGTPRTVKSRAFEKAIEKYQKFELKGVACPLFVPLVEEGWLEDPVTYQVAERYLEPLKKWGADTLILACTHYPLIKKVIGDVMGEDVILVDTAEEVAVEVERILKEKDMLNSSGGEVKYYVSDLSDTFLEVAKIFLGNGIEVEEVEVGG